MKIYSYFLAEESVDENNLYCDTVLIICASRIHRDTGFQRHSPHSYDEL